jgi:CBS domain-containing protein
MIAADVMTENPRTIEATDTIAQAVDALQSLEVRHLPVVNEEGDLVGMLSDRDLGPLMRGSIEGEEAERMVVPLSRTRVADVMTSGVVSVDVDADVGEIVETMLEQRIGAVPVVDGEGAVVGIISYVDVLREVVLQAEPEKRRRPRRPAPKPKKAPRPQKSRRPRRARPARGR